MEFRGIMRKKCNQNNTTFLFLFVTQILELVKFGILIALYHNIAKETMPRRFYYSFQNNSLERIAILYSAGNGTNNHAKSGTLIENCHFMLCQSGNLSYIFLIFLLK